MARRGLDQTQHTISTDIPPTRTGLTPHPGERDLRKVVFVSAQDEDEDELGEHSVTATGKNKSKV